MDVREKLVEIVNKAAYSSLPSNTEDFHLNMFVTNLLAHGVTVQEWISVKDRLPEDDSPVLVYKSRYSEAYGNMETAYYWNQRRWMGCVGETVTHWMPMPKPPKGE